MTMKKRFKTFLIDTKEETERLNEFLSTYGRNIEKVEVYTSDRDYFVVVHWTGVQ